MGVKVATENEWRGKRVKKEGNIFEFVLCKGGIYIEQMLIGRGCSSGILTFTPTI